MVEPIGAQVHARVRKGRARHEVRGDGVLRRNILASAPELLTAVTSEVNTPTPTKRCSQNPPADGQGEATPYSTPRRNGLPRATAEVSTHRRCQASDGVYKCFGRSRYRSTTAAEMSMSLRFRGS